MRTTILSICLLAGPSSPQERAPWRVEPPWIERTVQDCPVAVHYERAYKVHRNLLDGIIIRNCPLPVLVEGAATDPREGRKPEPFTDANVDRLVLKEWKPGAPVARFSGGVKVHTLADAGVWYDGAVTVEGDAKVFWASFAHVTVLDDGKPVAGAEVTCEGLIRVTGSNGRVRLRPFCSTEITKDGSPRRKKRQQSVRG